MARHAVGTAVSLHPVPPDPTVRFSGQRADEGPRASGGLRWYAATAREGNNTKN